MTALSWTADLRALRACEDARIWADAYPSLDAAWAACERADWMLWLLGRVAGPPESDARQPLVLCACACARTALRHITGPHVLTCIETTERWARGEATIGEVCDSRRAAYAAADAADAADAAANARRRHAAAYAAAYTAAAAADAADAAAAAYTAAASAYTAAAARCQSLKAMADIVRGHYPVAPQIGGAR